ncbi:MAG TPA: hypothetical protein VM677_34255 [Actinokineospora sp.]|nr:hypothetical protein [Actinokineospora sp.]
MTSTMTSEQTWYPDHQDQVAGCILVGEPGVTVNADGRDSVWVRGADDTLWSNPQERDCRTWNGWAQHATGIGGDPVPLLGTDGLIRVFYRGTGDELFVLTQQRPGQNFGDPVKLTGGCVSDPSVAMNADGRMTVVYRGSDGASWQVTQSSVANNTWRQAGSLGGSVKGRPAIGRAGDGLLSVVVRGGDDALWVTTQTSVNASTWGTFVSQGGNAGSDPFVTHYADQRLAVVYTSTNNCVHHIVQVGNYGFAGASTTHTDLGGTVVGPSSACLGADGRLHVFATAKADNQILTAEQSTINTTGFSALTGIGGDLSGDPVKPVTAVTVPHLLTIGIIDVFYRATDNQVHFASQTDLM